jgi:hypothetical protein
MKILLIIIFIFSFSTKSFSFSHDKILKDLNKAAEEIQKDLNKPDSKPKPQDSTSTKTNSNSNSSSSPSKQDQSKEKVNASNNFSLYGLKLNDPISSVKITNKQFEKDKLFGFTTILRVGAHVSFEPEIKNEYFDSFFITYGPISKKIEGIYGRSKQIFKNEGECLKASEDNFKFVIQKNISDNPSINFKISTSSANKISEDIVYFEPPSSEGIVIHNFCNPALGAASDYNWLAIFKDDRKTGIIIKELEQYNAEKSDKEFQKKKDSGKLKGL